MKAVEGALLKVLSKDPHVTGMINRYEFKNNKHASPVTTVKFISETQAEYYSGSVCVAIMEEKTERFSGMPRLEIHAYSEYRSYIGTVELNPYLSTWDVVYCGGDSKKEKRTLTKSETEQIFPKRDGTEGDEPIPVDSPPKKPQPDSKDDGANINPSGFAIFLVFGIFVFLLGWLGPALTDPLVNAHGSAYRILDVVQFITIEIPWLIALVFCLLFVRLPRGLGVGMTVYYVFLLLFTAAAMVFVGSAIDDLMDNFHNMRRPIYELSFNLTYLFPGLVYALILKFICRVTKKNRHHGTIFQITSKAAGIMSILTLVLILLARITAAYVWRFDLAPDGTLMILRLLWYVCLTSMCALIPGAIVSSGQ